MADDIALAASALKRVADSARWLANPNGPVERVSTVQACVACEGPCVPRALSHAGQGPLCTADYHSWKRFKASNPHGSFVQWQSVREVAA
jgi:hypothetical protein